MTRKPFPWRKLTPTQMDLMEFLAAADGVLPYDALDHRGILALNELQRLKFADIRSEGPTKLEAYLTSAGKALQADAYCTEQIVVRVTGPQIELMRHLLDGPIEDSVGQPMNELPSMAQDICRRMMLRGWVQWYDGWDGQRWAMLTPSGREVLNAVGSLDATIIQFDEARQRRGTI